MIILPVDPELQRYLHRHGLERKFKKQLTLAENDLFHPGLKTERLEPRNLKLWSFRLDRKYRVIFMFREPNVIEIIDVNNHYR